MKLSRFSLLIFGCVGLLLISLHSLLAQSSYEGRKSATLSSSSTRKTPGSGKAVAKTPGEKGKGDEKGGGEKGKEGEESEKKGEDKTLTLPEKIILYRCPGCYYTRDTRGDCPDDKLVCEEVLPGGEDPDLIRFIDEEKSIIQSDLEFFKDLLKEKIKAASQKKGNNP